MSRVRAGHDAFVVDGGCTCPGTRTLFQLRVEGHTTECAAARRDASERRRQTFETLNPPLARPAETRRLRDAG